MFEENAGKLREEVDHSATIRDLLAVGFRQRKLILHTFLAIFVTSIFVAFFLPRRYEAEMKILVRHERAESVVSPDRAAPVQVQTEVSEEELQSEAELLKSKDLLTRVAIACHLENLNGDSLWSTLWEKVAGHRQPERPEKDPRVLQAVVDLGKDLNVEPVKLTNLIRISYTSKDPDLAARVLDSLASLYFEKHLAMRRAPGVFEFFHQQSQEYRKSLAATETQLASFGREQGVVSPALKKEITVRKLAELEASSMQARAETAVTRQRIHTLETQLATLPSRTTTQVRTSDNPQLMERMKSTLLDLELKRDDLLAKYEPGYRPVQLVEQQIAETRQAIEAAEKQPLRDQTEDRDPTYESLRADLAKARIELAAQQTQASADARQAQVFRNEAQQLDQKEVAQQDLLRAAKADEENYLLYLRKEEEARISDALDRQRISNVVVAEAATVPLKPQGRRLWFILFGTLFASLASVGLGFAADYWNPSFRTPEEVESFLGSPVVAAFPKQGK